MSDDPKGVKLPPPNTNRGRLAHRAFTLAKLVSLNAPHVLVLNAMRLIQTTFMDCETYGYEAYMTFEEANRQIAEEEARLEAEHNAKHLDGKPVEGCMFCEEPL